MTKKYIQLLAILFVLLTFSASMSKPIWAGTFQLKSIGQMSVYGTNYKHWYNNGTNPAFTGSALPSTRVNIVIDGTTYSVTADGNGNWGFTPPPLAEGDHTVSIAASGASAITFTLTIGKNIPTSVVVPQPNQTPIAGNVVPLLGILAAGGLLVAFGLKTRTLQ